MKITTARLRQIIREEISASIASRLSEAKVGAGKAYLEGPEADFQKTLASLTKMLRDLPLDMLQILRNTDPAYDKMINDALDSVGIEDKARRDLIYRPLKMMRPVDISGLQRS